MRTQGAVVGLGMVLLVAAVVEARRAERAERAWFDDAARDEVARAAARFASLSAHLRASSGDPRFADRIAADPPVVAELLADVAFAQHQGLVERAQLVRFEPGPVKAVGLGLAEVRATEYWITRGGDPTGPTTRSDVVAVRYAMRHDAGGWRVSDWSLETGQVEGRESR